MNSTSVNGVCVRFKAHILMVLAQVAFTLMYIITEASFNHGMNPSVYITYRHIVAGLVMLPFAYFIERKTRPKLTLLLFLEIFVLSLLGVSLTLNMYFTSLKYTSPTFLACMVNTIPSLTFVLAVVLRMEIVNLGSLRGIAKILGTVISLGGVLTMTLYEGPSFKSIGHELIHIGGNKAVIHKNWFKGSLLTVASCITWSMWYIMQTIYPIGYMVDNTHVKNSVDHSIAGTTSIYLTLSEDLRKGSLNGLYIPLQAYTLKRYPAQLSLATWMNLVGAAQSAVFTVIVQHKQAAWTVGLNIDLWSTLYGGIVISGIVTFVLMWCTEAKGPVFVTIFNPLSAVLVAVLAYFVLNEKLYVGSIIGGIIVIIGLYLLLWGKEDDDEHVEVKEVEQCSKTGVSPSDVSNFRGEA